MERPYSVTIELKVHDKEELFEAAKQRSAAEGQTEEVTLSLLRDENGEVSVTDCLVMLLDPGSLPGVTILQSRAE